MESHITETRSGFLSMISKNIKALFVLPIIQSMMRCSIDIEFILI